MCLLFIGERSKTIQVFVCAGKLGDQCNLCGTYGSSTLGVYATVVCQNPLIGNVIRLTNTDIINVCELKYSACEAPEGSPVTTLKPEITAQSEFNTTPTKVASTTTAKCEFGYIIKLFLKVQICPIFLDMFIV